MATAAVLLVLALLLATFARAHGPGPIVPSDHLGGLEIAFGSPPAVSAAAFCAMAVAHLAAVFGSLRLAPTARWSLVGVVCSVTAPGRGLLLTDAPVGAAAVLVLGWLIAVTVGQTVGYVAVFVVSRLTRPPLRAATALAGPNASMDDVP